MKRSKIKEYISRSPDIAWRIIDKEAVLIILNSPSVDRYSFSILNETGTRIWEIMDGTKTVDDIAKVICEEFDVTYSRAKKEITEFISRLSEMGVVIIS